jgi:hypothetical protein
MRPLARRIWRRTIEVTRTPRASGIACKKSASARKCGTETDRKRPEGEEDAGEKRKHDRGGAVRRERERQPAPENRQEDGDVAVELAVIGAQAFDEAGLDLADALGAVLAALHEDEALLAGLKLGPQEDDVEDQEAIELGGKDPEERPPPVDARSCEFLTPTVATGEGFLAPVRPGSAAIIGDAVDHRPSPSLRKRSLLLGARTRRAWLFESRRRAFESSIVSLSRRRRPGVFLFLHRGRCSAIR